MSLLLRAASLAALSVLAMPLAHAEADTFSYAQPDKVRVKSLALDLTVDFAARQLAGSAELQLDWRDRAAHELVLDTRDLVIDRIEAWRIGGPPHAVKFELDAADPVRGAALRIALDGPAPAVRIHYHTLPQASGLQWMTPAQTAGKKQPFMYSQSQSIHARSWVPLQDTPAVRFTYRAHVVVPKALRAVMSANNDARHALDGDYRFTMDEPIPSYLLAIAVGDLAVRETGPRSAVYAEPSVVEKAAKEFSDTEKMIEATEKLYGPYRWGRYDILVLPPSFPFGGMENPRLTFATPTVLVGDKSLVSLVAHELAHSWSGNLVTNATWRHMWLNEGFTSYVENRIVEAVYGKEQADEEFIIGADELRREIAATPPATQWLVPQLDDADDAASDFAYVKGAWLLRTLEARFGRAEFDAYLRGYFDHFAFQSITTEQMLDWLQPNLLDKYPGKMSLDEVKAWIYGPGVPADATVPASPRLTAIAAARAQWLAGTRKALKLGAKDWNTHEWMYFLDGLPTDLDARHVAELDAAWHLNGSPNAEIARRWYLAAIRADYRPARAQMAKYMTRIGRRYLVVPLYEALAKTPNGLAFAREVYAKAKPGYHPLTQASIEKVLAGKPSGD
ncbi:MAG: M1 family metallopeptidase [Dokdonella sp.]|uniref:M1 family metallopeptidase n=1 Tax=Dokdonella sp. TaxID=2291710 RepID=UPI0025BBDCF5|nr:M1 family metallopeptidase [Dokdonella sp.]MBX3700152.1 M1 family metallopeptidase [Dokdonella sp.]